MNHHCSYATSSGTDDNSSLGEQAASEFLFEGIDAISFDVEECAILHPDADDVLLGRGKSNQSHPGNIKFQGRLLLLS